MRAKFIVVKTPMHDNKQIKKYYPIVSQGGFLENKEFPSSQYRTKNFVDIYLDTNQHYLILQNIWLAQRNNLQDGSKKYFLTEIAQHRINKINSVVKYYSNIGIDEQVCAKYQLNINDLCALQYFIHSK